MVTIFRSGGLNFVIFVDDREPAHVHVMADGQAKINIVGQDGRPELVWAHGFTRADIRKAVRIVEERQKEILSRWRDIHG
ncbi:DUF4160 domain-containing protein [Rhizobium deserti]|uniref:DUF4160 domain-containing protein n=1 Tax=Rhizobium deserti TaxID=2547961 RepID=A0A4R5UKT4_9HYPH|nr:DUF4160 domain-containing protein [Rhizobium deserti]TDK37434.1 DUF4160 domain-containing protein [Rhizobium deserti]